MTTEKNGRPVVVGVDGSDGADAAVRWAARYADETGSPLHLLFAAGHQTALIGVSTEELGQAEQARERVLASAAAAATPYEADAVLVRGSAAPALAEASAEADVLVLGESHRRSGLAVQVVAEAECPVVVVRGDEDWAGPVVVAVDDRSEAALGFAVREAARRDVALFAVHAWQQPAVPPGMVTPTATPTATADAARRSLTAVVEPWRTAFPEVAIHERLVEGPAATVVTHESGGAGLVVTGSRGRGRLAGMFLGSTSQALLRHAECPVAIIRN